MHGANMPKSAKPLARYFAWMRRGDLKSDFIFSSGVIAVDPAAGDVVMRGGDVPKGIGLFIGQTGACSGDAKNDPVLAQTLVHLRQYARYTTVRKMFFPIRLWSRLLWKSLR